jgi:hypothetical protein
LRNGRAPCMRIAGLLPGQSVLLPLEQSAAAQAPRAADHGTIGGTGSASSAGTQAALSLAPAQSQPVRGAAPGGLPGTRHRHPAWAPGMGTRHGGPSPGDPKNSSTEPQNLKNRNFVVPHG